MGIAKNFIVMSIKIFLASLYVLLLLTAISTLSYFLGKSGYVKLEIVSIADRSYEVIKMWAYFAFVVWLVCAIIYFYNVLLLKSRKY